MMLRVAVILVLTASVASGRMLESDARTLSGLDTPGPLTRIIRWYSTAGEVVASETDRDVSWSDVFPFWLGAKPGTAGGSTDSALTSKALVPHETNRTDIGEQNNETETNSEEYELEETTTESWVRRIENSSVLNPEDYLLLAEYYTRRFESTLGLEDSSVLNPEDYLLLAGYYTRRYESTLA